MQVARDVALSPLFIATCFLSMEGEKYLKLDEVPRKGGALLVFDGDPKSLIAEHHYQFIIVSSYDLTLYGVIVMSIFDIPCGQKRN